MSLRFLITILSTSLGLLSCLASCDKSTKSACTPGATLSCACPGGTTGAQTCSDDGSRFQSCVCLAANSGTAPAVVTAAVAPSQPIPAEKPLISYTAQLTEQDHFNSAGRPLARANTILVQDRAFKHSGLVYSVDDHAGDSSDDAYKTLADRKKFAELLAKVKWAPGVEEAIAKRTARVEVSVYADKVDVKLLDAGQPLADRPDIKNAAFPIKIGGRPIQFKDGSVQMGEAFVSLGDHVRYADICGAYPGPETLLALSYEGSLEGIPGSNGAGSFLLVLGQRDGKFDVIYSEVRGSEQDKVSDVRPSKRGVEVRGTAFDPNDATCCPSNSHVTTYTIRESGGVCMFTKDSRTLKPIPESDGKMDLNQFDELFEE